MLNWYSTQRHNVTLKPILPLNSKKAHIWRVGRTLRQCSRTANKQRLVCNWGRVICGGGIPETVKLRYHLFAYADEWSAVSVTPTVIGGQFTCIHVCHSLVSYPVKQRCFKVFGFDYYEKFAHLVWSHPNGSFLWSFRYILSFWWRLVGWLSECLSGRVISRCTEFSFVDVCRSLMSK